MRSGYVAPNYSRLRYAGDNGYYWSGRAYSSNHAYKLYITSSHVYPSRSDGRYYGFSVRCVAGWE